MDTVTNAALFTAVAVTTYRPDSAIRAGGPPATRRDDHWSAGGQRLLKTVAGQAREVEAVG